MKKLTFIEKKFDKFLLKSLKVGSLEIKYSSGKIKHYGNGPYPKTNIIIHHPRAIRKFIINGEIAFAESYINGDWDSDNLPHVFLIALKNHDSFRRYVDPPWFVNAPLKLWHYLRKNTLNRSPKNISDHYDISNAFYQKWLDSSMTYSSAIFASKQEELYEAQQRKLLKAAELAELKKNSKVLEIGGGWGSFAELAINKFKCKVHSITLSKEQYNFTKKRLNKQKIEDKAKIQILDYRKVSGVYDAIVSIEMFEAVGKEYWLTYMKKISDCLKPKGKAILQIITVSSDHFKEYEKKVDFIQRYIFPGGYLPSPIKIKEIAEKSGLKIEKVYFFGKSYALTLSKWRARFLEQWPEIKKQSEKFDEEFKRKWEYYLSYCEAGFISQRTNVGQYVIRRD